MYMYTHIQMYVLMHLCVHVCEDYTGNCRMSILAVKRRKSDINKLDWNCETIM